MAGGLFAADRREFLRLGGYDPEMRLYGGEEMEIGFRTWMCGGDIEYVPCSHVGHVFRSGLHWKGQAYVVAGEEIQRNKLRTAAIWMDDYQKLVQYATPPLPASMSLGDLSDRIDLRKRLGCRNFQWYIDNVVPNMFVPNLTGKVYDGALSNRKHGVCIDTLGATSPNQFIGAYPCHGQLGTQALVMDSSGRVLLPQMDYKACLATEEGTLYAKRCVQVDGFQWELDANTKQFRFKDSGLCLESSRKASSHSSYSVVMKPCAIGVREQQWSWS